MRYQDYIINMMNKCEAIRQTIVGASTEPFKVFVSNGYVYLANDYLVYKMKCVGFFGTEEMAYLSDPTYIMKDEDGKITSFDPYFVKPNYPETLIQYATIEKNVVYGENCPLLYEDTQFSDSPAFQDVLGKKVADGAQAFVIMDITNDRKFAVPYYPGFFKLKKSDKYSICVYDMFQYHFVRFTIKKPKTENIYVYYRYLKLE